MADACEDVVNDVLGGVGRTGQQEREPKQRARVRLIDVTKGLETARSSGVHVRPEGNSLRVVHTIITHEQPEPLQRICHDSAMLNLPEPGVVPVDSAHGIGQAGRVSVLAELFVTMAAEDRAAVEAILAASPSLVTAGLARADEFFVAARRAQVYEGDTALHAASFCYDAGLARDLIARGADVRARNRRGAEPLHSAMIGSPGAATWNPSRQRAAIACLIDAGADPNAMAAGGATPLHRAVRNRCSGAVEILLRLGADPRVENGSGSTAHDLARWTTGRGGTGSDAAKAEQLAIMQLLEGLH